MKLADLFKQLGDRQEQVARANRNLERATAQRYADPAVQRRYQAQQLAKLGRVGK